MQGGGPGGKVYLPSFDTPDVIYQLGILLPTDFVAMQPDKSKAPPVQFICI